MANHVTFVAVVALLALAFRPGPSANPVSRALTVMAIVENGTLRTDPWANVTSDKAVIDGHTYGDKAPLSSFVVVPSFFVWHAVTDRHGTRADIGAAVLLGEVFASAIPFGAFVLLVARRAARAVAPRDAVWMALAGACGTFALAYAGTYMGHVLAGALFVFAYHEATVASGRPALAGLLAGLAVLTELPTLPAVLLLGLYLSTRGWRPLLRFTLGAVPCALAFGVYDLVTTGSVFDPPYKFVPPEFVPPRGRAFALDAQGFFALDAQAWHAARELLFSEYRGVFFWAPALLLLLPLAAVRAPAARRSLLLATTATLFFLVATYWTWAGGWCIGPRHLVPLVMLLVYEGVFAVAQVPRAHAPFAVLAVLGIAINLTATATNPFVQSTLHPLRDIFLPALLRGEIVPTSLFVLVGLHGAACVAAWCGLFVASAAGLGWLVSRDETFPRPA
jgi:hypothetical protein